MTPEELYAYANKFARRAEDAGEGTRYPTMRQATKQFKVRLSDIEDACQDYCGRGYLGLAVGFRTGSGYGVYAVKGDCLVEAYD